jgi:hypothetical protein
MHTVDQLENVMAVAEALGYRVRQEWLDGSGGGVCEIAGKKTMFVDLALSTAEQLDQAIDDIREDPAIHTLQISPIIADLLGIKWAA